MKKIYLLLLALLCSTTFALAQVTTASMSGRITGSDGQPLVGATVQAVHVPSGTRYGTSTDAVGLYTIAGMRAGSGYRVEVAYLGTETAVFENMGLKLGETTNLSAQLVERANAIEDVVVTAKGGIDANKTGAAASMNSVQIERMPSVTGSVADVIRLNPQVRVSSNGAMSFAGTNNRYNSFQIDGAMNNDVFGLTSNGANGGQAGTQPIAMETVEQLQINVAPYDVTQSGFTGGAINAVTKSGTNQFHGSAYGFGNNQWLIGHSFIDAYGKETDKYKKETDYRAGLTLGGPIIKNKLFFFVNYERADKHIPIAKWNGDYDQANQILEKVKEMAKAQGVEYTGGFSNKPAFTSSDKIGLKLDWNISDKHKASVRYSLVDAQQMMNNSGSGSLNTNDYAYIFESINHSIVGELQSRFSDRVSNEFRVSYVRTRDERNPGARAPMIQIKNVGKGVVNIGNERSSMANSLAQDAITISDNVNLYLGTHTLTLGTHNEFYKFSNLFIQNTYGTYYYNSMADFMAGKIAQYQFQQANTDVTGDPRWKATFRTGQLGFYVQDKYVPNEHIDVTMGLRLDVPLFFDTPTENKGFNEYSASKGWGHKTNNRMSSTPMVSPRFGFHYNIDDQRRYVLRGGVGVFTGRIPFVWLSNNFSNTGIQMSTYYANDVASSNLSLILDPNNQTANVDKLQAGGGQSINVFSRDFRFAQNLRVNLGFDFELGGIEWTAEAIYSKTLNDVLYRNLAYNANGKTLNQVIPELEFDNRPMFGRVTNGTPYNSIYELSNTSKGYSYNLSLKAEKHMECGLDLAASYTFSRSKTVNNGTSSVAQSNWNYNYTHGDSNNPELGNSAFNYPHTINASVFYNKSYGAWQTTVGLIYTGSSGAPYSIYYNGDLNGDSSSGNDLFYIPTNEQIDKMPFRKVDKYTVAEQRANMKSWIESHEYLREHRGQYYERNADNEPFEHHFDFHLAQKFSFNRKGHTNHSIELSFDMLNVGSLFSKEWGRYSSSGGSASYYNPVNYDAKSKTFTFEKGSDYRMHTYSDYLSRWRGQVGLKYTF